MKIVLILALVAGCTTTPPQTLDTWTGEWETPPSEGWQCDGQPCTEEQLEQLVEVLEQAQ